MIPERLKPKIERLGEIANRNDGTDVGDLALEVASYIAEEEHVEPRPGPSFSGLAELEAKVDARFVTHELAITELYRRLGPDVPAEPEADFTVFKVPVVLADGVTPDQIREAISELPTGLDQDVVLSTLEERGLLTRTPTKGA